MAQRQKSGGDLILAEQPTNGAGPAALTESEVTMPAKVVQIGSSESDSPGRSPAGREGQVVGVEKDKIVGWAWDAAKPYEPVDVEMFVGNLRVGHGSADRFDMDLATAKRGNGMHRFELS